VEVEVEVDGKKNDAQDQMKIHCGDAEKICDGDISEWYFIS
jgi:hypothetical protein